MQTQRGLLIVRNDRTHRLTNSLDLLGQESNGPG